MKLVSLPLLAILALIVPACGNRYTRDAADTAFAELKASELNRKYEWFKDAHARLAALDATITTRKAMGKNDETLLGTIATRNALAAEYNAEMSKWHTAFMNAGTVPAGSSLPRAVIEYVQ